MKGIHYMYTARATANYMRNNRVCATEIMFSTLEDMAQRAEKYARLHNFDSVEIRDKESDEILVVINIE